MITSLVGTISHTFMPSHMRRTTTNVEIALFRQLHNVDNITMRNIEQSRYASRNVDTSVFMKNEVRLPCVS